MFFKDILTTLRREHDEVRALFVDLTETVDQEGSRRDTLLARILSNLLPHTQWEETVLYPEFELRADRDGQQTHAEAVQGHRVVELRVIPDLLRSQRTTPEFAGRAKVFAAMVEHHAAAEEVALFACARRAFTDQELRSMDRHYAAWKTSDPARLIVTQAVKDLRFA
jgi:hypothetical protein